MAQSGEITNPSSRSRPPSTRMELLPCGIGHFHDTPRRCQILLPEPGEQMNDQRKIRAIKASGTGMPEICCPECVTATLDENFTCPACLYFMSRQVRLDYDIFWDNSRSCWYRPRLTPA